MVPGPWANLNGVVRGFGKHLLKMGTGVLSGRFDLLTGLAGLATEPVCSKARSDQWSGPRKLPLGMMKPAKCAHPMIGRQNVTGKLIDLSHTIEEDTRTYPGLPSPSISAYMSYEESRSHYEQGTEFRVGRIDLVANTGTYLDAPSHRFRGAKDLVSLGLEKLADLPGIVVHVAYDQRRAIGRSHFEGPSMGGKAVLVRTGWSKHFGSEAYFEGHPFLTEGAAAYLVDQGAALVGIDSLNIDDTEDGRRPVHTILLRNEIPVVEHLAHLEALPERGFRFFAVPAKIRGLDSFPVRAFALSP